MDDMDDDARYHQKSYPANHHNSSSRRKIHIRSTQYSRPVSNRYAEEDDDELDEFDEGNAREYHAEEEEIDHLRGINRNFDADEDIQRHPKKRKMKTLESSYEFAPRARLPPYRGQNSRVEEEYRGQNSRGEEEYRGQSSRGEEEWTEHAVFVLLEVWGDRFLHLGRKSLRSEDWNEVAEKVSEQSKIERTDTQCRSMLDMLKRKYKKEKAKVEEMGLNSSKWAYFKKMDMLMASSLRQECGLACGVDSGEYVFMNTRVYLDRSNGFDEMRDSPGESEADDDENENDDFDVFGSRMGMRGGEGEDGSSYRVLADSINKFGEIYEKIEISKRKQMRELEKMRKDFNKELELQKKQILERAQVEIAKIQEADDDDDDDDVDEETDVSAEDLSE